MIDITVVEDLGKALSTRIYEYNSSNRSDIESLVETGYIAADDEVGKDPVKFVIFTKWLIRYIIEDGDIHSINIVGYDQTAYFYKEYISFIINDLTPVLNKLYNKYYENSMELDSVMAMISENVMFLDSACAAWATAAKWVAQDLEETARKLRVLNVKPLKERVKLIRAINDSIPNNTATNIFGCEEESI
ncbi:MAG: hypothetical protein HDQ88_06890 [Clostridia bacterium]|nr:hypothetical protein [Clostridia bacterium]